MENVLLWVQQNAAAIQAISAAVVALLTVLLIVLTYKTVRAYQKQVEIGQKQIKIGQNQVKETQRQIANQFRPVLHPLNKLEGIIDSQNGLVRWGTPAASLSPMKGFRNIGAGPAFNIYAIFFGKPFQQNPPREHYVVWNYGVLGAGEEGPPLTLSQGQNVESSNTIDSYPLYVPDDPQHNGVLARLTITYHDAFGRKFASMYDYQKFIGWMCIRNAENIEYDLHDLDAMNPMTQQSNEFFWRLGKSRP